VLRSPMPGVEINSGFGMRKHPVFRVAKMHWGVDFPAQHGTAIIAAADGVITAAKRYGNYGLYMHIDHGQNVATTYGHMSSFAPGMKPGAKVKAGDVIAHVGRTGVATGPHLYFEVVIGERRVDPEPLIAEGGSRLIGSDLLAFERIKLQSGVTEVASESRN
jgi:murein DD-endopeptidase MepM/ murein hydrolase activator NlpD